MNDDPPRTSAPPRAVTTWTFQDDEESARFRRDQLERVATFLHQHLDAYGDPFDQIERCLQEASSRAPELGGTVTVAADGDDTLVGVVVTRRTHMGGYAPENLLVYVAAHGARRGEGIGRSVMEAALAAVDGAVALHVEPDNPARHLYERLGFTHKYLEMRREAS